MRLIEEHAVVFSAPSPIASEKPWMDYMKFLGQLDTDDESIVLERERAKNIIELIKEDSYF